MVSMRADTSLKQRHPHNISNVPFRLTHFAIEALLRLFEVTVWAALGRLQNAADRNARENNLTRGS